MALSQTSVLNQNGKIGDNFIPDFAITEFIGNFSDAVVALPVVISNESQKGDWFTTDEDGGKTYFVNTNTVTSVSDFIAIRTSGSGGAGGAFELSGDVIKETDLVGISTKDFVVGADTPFNTTEGPRMFFDSSKGAFRAGNYIDNRWGEGVLGPHSTAFGSGTDASGDYSTALGLGAIARGLVTLATGESTIAHGAYSSAFGYNTYSKGYYSTAMGFNSQSLGVASIALGYGVKSQASLQFACGRYNIPRGSASLTLPTDPIFTVGNGVSDTYRSNAFEVNRNGDTKIGGTLNVADVPTSSLGLVAGDIWNDNGSLKII